MSDGDATIVVVAAAAVEAAAVEAAVGEGRDCSSGVGRVVVVRVRVSLM